MNKIKLACFHCGEGKEVEVNEIPRFAFELAIHAEKVGMIGFLDQKYGRVLVFCNPEHARAQMTKAGMFRRTRKVMNVRPRTASNAG